MIRGTLISVNMIHPDQTEHEVDPDILRFPEPTVTTSEVYTEHEMRRRLQVLAIGRDHGELAADMGISAEQVAGILYHKAAITAQVAAQLGYDRVVLFVAKEGR